MGEDCLSYLTCVLFFCLFEQYNMLKKTTTKKPKPKSVSYLKNITDVNMQLELK